jgi:hypothetical protein
MTKQILPNKLRVVVSRRTQPERNACADLRNNTDPYDDCADEPPTADFAAVQTKALDLLNVDIKFPSEHTVCGRRYDGEMQYYYFHPVRRSLVAVAWLLEAVDDDDDDDDVVENSTHNAHMQLLIDEFRKVYEANEGACRARDGEVAAAANATVVAAANSTVGGGGPAIVPMSPSSSTGEPLRSLRGEVTGRTTSSTASHGSPSSDPSGNPSGSPSGDPGEYPSEYPSHDPSDHPSHDPSHHPSHDPSDHPSHDPSEDPTATAVPTATSGPSASSLPTVDPGPWDPFHPDIQKTIHFWGYSGSLTEVPCTDVVLWRIMDVPVRISTRQLDQMRTALFDNRDPNRYCAYTSTHFDGSVARPIVAGQNLTYYKCTRDDYVSDKERIMCGRRRGCLDRQFGPHLDPYVEPILLVTGPPSGSPTYSMSPSTPATSAFPSGSPTASTFQSGSPTASLAPIGDGGDGPI